MLKNDKGFVLTEVLILSAVVIGLLVFIFIQFKNVDRSYQYSFKYDTVQGMYLANNFVNYINENDFDTLVQYLTNSMDKYIDITDCSIDYFSVSSFCENLILDSEIEKILFTYEDTSLIDRSNLSEDMKLYINSIKTLRNSNDYRIIVKYNDGTFASMRFNKGDVYVQKGLIAYLDGINNTGYGHSNDTNIWKDLSGNGNDAILYNSPVWSNNSLMFDGVSNYGRLENTVGIEFSNGASIEARVKVLSLLGGTTVNGQEFFSNWESAGIGMKMKNNQVFRAGFYDTKWRSVENSVSSNLNEYYTVTLTYDNSVHSLYINGVLISTDTYNDSGVIKTANVPFGIGGNPKDTSVTEYNNVEFENVLIYDRALTSEEVARNYQVDMVKY